MAAPRSHDFSGVKFNKHRGVCLQLFHWNSKSEVVEHQELEFQVVQLRQGESTNLSTINIKAKEKKNQGLAYLCISRVCIKDIREEFAGASYPGDD